ncbi:MAG: hypothetical protein SRB2_02913 [Desulfobacteraceae bacterium Eth-SRB2]|nr:MAG: hypothetical protein SRB2_02913 [Desulfobacteraceae bacterium Eth-SRB2]
MASRRFKEIQASILSRFVTSYCALEASDINRTGHSILPLNTNLSLYDGEKYINMAEYGKIRIDQDAYPFSSRERVMKLTFCLR